MIPFQPDRPGGAIRAGGGPLPRLSLTCVAVVLGGARVGQPPSPNEVAVEIGERQIELITEETGPLNGAPVLIARATEQLLCAIADARSAVEAPTGPSSRAALLVSPLRVLDQPRSDLRPWQLAAIAGPRFTPVASLERECLGRFLEEATALLLGSSPRFLDSRPAIDAGPLVLIELAVSARAIESGATAPSMTWRYPRVLFQGRSDDGSFLFDVAISPAEDNEVATATRWHRFSVRQNLVGTSGISTSLHVHLHDVVRQSSARPVVEAVTRAWSDLPSLGDTHEAMLDSVLRAVSTTAHHLANATLLRIAESVSTHRQASGPRLSEPEYDYLRERA
jgi:hypothetical protein